MASRLAVACLFALAVAPLRADDAKPPVTQVALPDKALDFAIQPDTGTVAVIAGTRPEVVLYPQIVAQRSLDGAKTVALGRPAAEIAFKKVGPKNLFVVLVPEDRAIVLVDADAATVVGKIAVAGVMPHNLRVTQAANDPYAYFCIGGGHDGRPCRANLLTGRDEGVIEGTDPVARVEVSGDAATLYTHGPGNPSGVRAYALDPARTPDSPPRARQLFWEHASARYYLPDPYGQYVVRDGKVFSPDMRQSLAGISIDPAYISPTRPWMVALLPGRVLFLSTNRFESLGVIDLPADPAAKPDAPAGPVRRPPAARPQVADTDPVRVLEHAGSNTLLVCKGKGVQLLSLATLPDEPFLAFSTVDPLRLSVGKPGRIALRLRDPATKLEIVQGPTGLALDGSTLTWTPSDGTVGTHVVRLKLSAGKLAVARSLDLVVGRPGVELKFPVGHLAASADGSTALALGGDAPGKYAEPHPGHDEARNRLALIDIPAAAVRAERRFETSIQSVALDQHHVYAAAANADALYVLGRSDLRDVNRLFLPGRAKAITSVAGRWLFVACERPPGQFDPTNPEQNQVTVLKLPELAPAEPAEVGTGGHLKAKGVARTLLPPVALGDGWWYDGCLYDAAFGKPLALAQPPGFAANRQVTPDSPFGAAYSDPAGAYPAWATPWSAVPTHGTAKIAGRPLQLTGGARQQLGQDRSTTLLLAAQPAVAALRQSTESSGTGSRRTLRLEFHELATGVLGLSLPLSDEPLPTQRYEQPVRHGAGGVHLAECAGTIVAACERQLYFVTVPTLDAARFGPPLRFQPRLPTTALNDGATNIPLPPLVGGKPPFELSFREPVPGVEVDPAANALRLDRGLLQAEARKLAAAVCGIDGDRAGVSPHRSAAIGVQTAISIDGNRGVAGPRHLTIFSVRTLISPALASRPSVAEYLRTAGPLFERWAGRKAAGVPVWVSVALTARDQNLQAADLDVGFFVEVPEGDLKPKPKPPPEAVTPAPPPPPPATAEDAAREIKKLQLRVNELERRLLELQEAVDKLREKGGKP